MFSNLSFDNIIHMSTSKASLKEKEIEIEQENIVGKLIIDKLNINNNLYSINSTLNNVDKNVTILNNSITPDNDNSIMFIAAHSGTGKAAYFRHLDELAINDEVKLIYNDKEYYYKVKNYWEEKKDGDINVLKEDKKQLILTTCSPTKDDMQLVINCIEK